MTEEESIFADIVANVSKINGNFIGSKEAKEAEKEAIRAFIQKGLDDLSAGRAIPSKTVMAKIRAKYGGETPL